MLAAMKNVLGLIFVNSGEGQESMTERKLSRIKNY